MRNTTARRLAQILRTAGIIDADDLAAAGGIDGEEPLAVRLVRLGIATEERIAEAVATELRLPLVRIVRGAIPADTLQRVPEALAERYTVLPLEVNGHVLRLAMADALDLDAVRDVEFRSGLSVRPAVATPSEIGAGIAHSYLASQTEPFLSELQKSPDTAGTLPNAFFTGDEIVDVRKRDAAMPVVRMVNLLLSEGIRAGASDIHVEPGDGAVAVRNRVDGVLREAFTVPKWLHAGLVSRLKILANLDIAERRRPQDGRMKVQYGDHALDLRVSVLPTHLGEKVVLRLLGPGREVFALDHLGLEPGQMALLEDALAQPQGTILVTGPTGSGKTSTLYGALSRLKSPGVNIVTLENPVELQIPGINQVQVHERAGLTFASSLRSVLRQDPDVIMVGEIRDPETAETAFQAALTGHLVLSTLHTNSAASAITRLLDLGVEPFLVASSVSVVIAQRLLRRLCVHCREPYRPAPDVLARLGLPPAATPIYRAPGCDRCYHTGSQGRVAVFEILPIDSRIRGLILERAHDSVLEEEAAARGFVTLIEAAALKVRQGITSPDEVFRVIQHDGHRANRCPGCNARVEPTFAMCPGCETVLKPKCSACRQDLRPEWRVCPFCCVPVERRLRAAS